MSRVRAAEHRSGDGARRHRHRHGARATRSRRRSRCEMNKIGEGHPWKFSHFRKTEGYANMPLDGLWLRAPYLHNGSVPDSARAALP